MNVRPLTEREHQILDLLADGRSLKEIKVTLGISLWTVKAHVRSAKAKAGLTGPVHRLVVWYSTLSKAA